MSIDVWRVGRIYHYRFQVKPFRRVQRSTRLRDKQKALVVAERAYSAAVARANGGNPIPTLIELINEWHHVHACHSSAHHVRSIKTFTKLHLYGMGDRLVSELDTITVERARALHLNGRAFSTANHWLRILKLLVSWAVKRKILPRLPWDVAMLSVQKRPRAILPMADVLSWFEVVDQAGRAPALSTAARLMLWLGLRESEVITARWEWFDWERATYTPGLTKGREADALRVLPQLAGYLAPLRATEGLVACRADGTPYGPGFMRDVIRVANAACKIKGITPHRLRGTIATWLSESGTPAQDVQAFLRHKDIRTTMAYLEKNMDRVSAAQEKIAEKAGLTWRENGEQL